MNGKSKRMNVFEKIDESPFNKKGAKKSGQRNFAR